MWRILSLKTSSGKYNIHMFRQTIYFHYSILNVTFMKDNITNLPVTNFIQPLIQTQLKVNDWDNIYKKTFEIYNIFRH